MLNPDFTGGSFLNVPCKLVTWKCYLSVTLNPNCWNSLIIRYSGWAWWLSGSQLGVILLPCHSAMSADLSGCHNLGDRVNNWWVESRDAFNLLQHTGQPPTTKNYSAMVPGLRNPGLARNSSCESQAAPISLLFGYSYAKLNIQHLIQYFSPQLLALALNCCPTSNKSFTPKPQ